VSQPVSLSSRDQRAAMALAVGAVLVVGARWLVLLSHGPTSEDQMRDVLGLTHHDFQRWAALAGLPILWGLWTVGRARRGADGRLGRLGFAMLFAGYVLAALGLTTSYILFDPFDHPLHAVGFLMSLLALVPVGIGWLVWAAAIVRSPRRPSWMAPLAVFGGLGTFVPLLVADGLVDTLSIDPGTAIQLCHSITFGGLAVAMWSRPERGS
jgi:hypothetical protein